MTEYYNHPEIGSKSDPKAALRGEEFSPERTLEFLVGNGKIDKENLPRVNRVLAVANVSKYLANVHNSFIGLPKTPALDKALWNTRAMMQNTSYIMKNVDRLEEESKFQGMDVGLRDHYRWVDSVFTDPAVKADPTFHDTFPGLMLKHFNDNVLPQEIERFYGTK